MCVVRFEFLFPLPISPLLAGQAVPHQLTYNVGGFMHLGVKQFNVRCIQNFYELPSALADGIQMIDTKPATVACSIKEQLLLGRNIEFNKRVKNM
jgi:hypothetical protein